ncbi:MAG TPA: GMC oxidoreductase [Steroidobacteraceae bacterium]|jgi:hypothetical protein
MLLDARLTDEVGPNLACDAVIVGAGPVGLYLAALLIERNVSRDIIVVEAGSHVADTSRNAASSSSIGKFHGGVLDGRAAGLGGTSALWGGQLAEFDATDLERQGTEWPMTHAELRKLYGTVYERLGLGPPQSDNNYRQRLGRESESSDSAERFFTYWLSRPNFAAQYGRMIRGSEQVRVIVNLTARDMKFDGPAGQVLECSAAERCITIKASKFVFASGTVATSRFFLSTQRSGRVPWVDNVNVGHYFQDHLAGKIAQVDLISEQRFRDFFENGWVDGLKLQPKLAMSERSRRALPSAACGQFMYVSSVRDNLGQLKNTLRSVRANLSFSSAASRARDLVAVGRSMVPLVTRFVRKRRMFALFDEGLFLEVQAEQIPIHRSRVALHGEERGADGLYPVAVDWHCDGGELEAIRTLATECEAYLESRGIAHLTLDPVLMARDPRFIDGLLDTFHQCGGMRMARSPASGVVDFDARVWGTDNVFVAGASIFPSSSHANCTLTALALATRLAARLGSP